MKKIIIWSASILLIVGGGLTAFVLTSAKKEAIPETRNIYTQQELKILEKAGFKNSRNLALGGEYDGVVNVDKSEFYRKKYGMKYFSEEGINKFLEARGLVKGNTSDYFGEIPSINITEMKNSLDKLTFQTVYYYNESSLKGNGVLGYIPESNIRQSVKALIDAVCDGCGTPSVDEAVIKNLYSMPNHSFFMHKMDAPKDAKPPLMIIAPKEEFDMDNKDIINNTVTERRRDPIIIAVVPDGYLILTHWE